MVFHFSLSVVLLIISTSPTFIHSLRFFVIGNSLSSFGTLSFNFSAYDYALYFFIPHNMTKRTPLHVPHSIYYMSCSCHPVQNFFICNVSCIRDAQNSSVEPHFDSFQSFDHSS